jgi:hypothetical protein
MHRRRVIRLVARDRLAPRGLQISREAPQGHAEQTRRGWEMVVRIEKIIWTD